MKKNKNRLLLLEAKRVASHLAASYKPEKVVLFGSLARGKASKDSDLDLLVIKKTKKSHWERLAEIEQYIEHNVPMDILVYTPEEVKQRLSMPDYFLEEIMKNGKTLYQKEKREPH